MALSQGNKALYTDIRALFDKVNAERHRLLNEAVSSRTNAPGQGTKINASTPNTLKTLAAGAISGNTYARTDLASTLTSINGLANQTAGTQITANMLSSLNTHLTTITNYKPSIRTGTGNYFSGFNFKASFTSGFSSFTAARNGTFTTFRGFCSGSFATFTDYCNFEGYCGDFCRTGFNFFSGFNRSFSTYFGGFCRSFSTPYSRFCRSGFFGSFGYFGEDECSTYYFSFGGCSTYFGSFGGCSSYNSSFGFCSGTFFGDFGSFTCNAFFTSFGFRSFNNNGGFCSSGFTAARGSFNSAWGSGCPSAFFSSFLYSFSGFNNSFCPAEFCTSFNAASFFNGL